MGQVNLMSHSTSPGTTVIHTPSLQTDPNSVLRTILNSDARQQKEQTGESSTVDMIVIDSRSNSPAVNTSVPSTTIENNSTNSERIAGM